MINKVILIGYTGKDPETKYLEGNVCVSKFSVATNESYKPKGSDEYKTITEWHDIVTWRALAEMVEKRLKKGQQVFVEGKLTHRKYTDKDGVDRYVTEIVANTVRLLGSRPNNDAGLPDEPPEQKESPSGYDDLPF